MKKIVTLAVVLAMLLSMTFTVNAADIELISGGDYEGKSYPQFSTASIAEGEGVNGSKAWKMECGTSTATKIYYGTLLYCAGGNLKVGSEYTLTFSAKGTGSGQALVKLNNCKAYFKNADGTYAETENNQKTITLSTDYQVYTIGFKLSSETANKNHQLNFVFGGNSNRLCSTDTETAYAYIDNVSLVEHVYEPPAEVAIDVSMGLGDTVVTGRDVLCGSTDGTMPWVKSISAAPTDNDEISGATIIAAYYDKDGVLKNAEMGTINAPATLENIDMEVGGKVKFYLLGSLDSLSPVTAKTELTKTATDLYTFDDGLNPIATGAVEETDDSGNTYLVLTHKNTWGLDTAKLYCDNLPTDYDYIVKLKYKVSGTVPANSDGTAGPIFNITPLSGKTYPPAAMQNKLTEEKSEWTELTFSMPRKTGFKKSDASGNVTEYTPDNILLRGEKVTSSSTPSKLYIDDIEITIAE